MRPYTRYPPTFDQDGDRGEGSNGSSGNDFSYPKKESIGEGTASEGSQRQLSKSCETGLDIYLAQSAFTTSRVRRAVTPLRVKTTSGIIRHLAGGRGERGEGGGGGGGGEGAKGEGQRRIEMIEEKEGKNGRKRILSSQLSGSLHCIGLPSWIHSLRSHLTSVAAEELRNSSLRSRVAECLPARYSTARKRKKRRMRRGVDVEKKKKKEKEEEWETSAPYLRDPPKADRETKRAGRRWRYLPGNWIGISFFTIVRGSGRR
ncbi:hypothetical protein V1478_009426 [Vespula squamosa]|uniref:Uncharacterized protein n=1 Tax=Vespula squamosa TaxID=30214 RepID=A0ABD2APM2_VESSQ